MRTLDLTKSVYPHNTSAPWSIKEFPDNHQHIDIASVMLQDKVWIKMRIRNGNDLFLLEQAVYALRERKSDIQIHLYCTYLLAARYDRSMYYGDSFDLKIVCNQLNRMNFDSITLVEPHSNISTALLDKVKVDKPLDREVAEHILVLQQSEKVVIFAPDLGAVKRVEDFIKAFQLDVEVGYLHKTRNLKTGEILGMRLMDSTDLTGRICILFDDLCDAGRTFIEASKILREHNAHQVHLAITHGLFSKGYDNLLKAEDGKIDFIITTNSYKDLEAHPQVKVHTI